MALMASTSVTISALDRQYRPGSAPMEMSMWLAPPKARLAAGTLGTIFS